MRAAPVSDPQTYRILSHLLSSPTSKNPSPCESLSIAAKRPRSHEKDCCRALRMGKVAHIWTAVDVPVWPHYCTVATLVSPVYSVPPRVRSSGQHAPLEQDIHKIAHAIDALRLSDVLARLRLVRWVTSDHCKGRSKTRVSQVSLDLMTYALARVAATPGSQCSAKDLRRAKPAARRQTSILDMRHQR